MDYQRLNRDLGTAETALRLLNLGRIRWEGVHLEVRRRAATSATATVDADQHSTQERIAELVAPAFRWSAEYRTSKHR